MKIIIGFFIFCLVLFLYLHIQFHLKKSNDLEIYEIDNPSKDKLEEICDLRQPVLFDFDCEILMHSLTRTHITNNYNTFEIKLRNNTEDDDNTELYIPLQLKNAIKLFDNDKNEIYFTENNSDFLEETGLSKNMCYNDSFLRPSMLSNVNYDIIMGSVNTVTPFKFELNYRNYFLLTEGSAIIKLTPPNNIKYLYPNYNYENFEFKSLINPWNPQMQYINDFNKIKFLEFNLKPGKTLYIPAYWWYSIKFKENTSIACFKYKTYMNNLAISPYIFMYILQNQNIKRNVVKNYDISKLNCDNQEKNEETTKAEQDNVNYTDRKEK